MKIKCIQTFVYLGDQVSIGEEFEGVKEFMDFYWITKNNNIIEIPKRFFEIIKELKGMDFHTKYSIGDKVIPIYGKYGKSSKPCPACKGKGKVDIDGVEYICRMCYGKGLDINSEITYEVRPGRIWTITGVFISKSDKEQIEYTLNNEISDNYQYIEEDLFLSEQEALDECDKRNNKK
jgi:hypothetical protein